MTTPQRRPGVRSPEFLRLMLLQVPVGVMIGVVGYFALPSGAPRVFILIVAAVITGYALIVSAIIAASLRRR